MKANILVGKTLTGIKIAEDKKALLFETTDGNIVARCDGDCCSSTWVENVDNTVREFPALVLTAEDVDMPRPADAKEDEEDYDVTAYYGFKIVTEYGAILIDYRNSSNGYYGGNLSWPDDDYYYGGVSSQNVSNEEWVEIAE